MGEQLRRKRDAERLGALEVENQLVLYRRLNGKLVAGFKAAATHCSYHPMSGDTVATLEADLAGYDTSRGTVRFSARAGLPATLVRKLVKARIAEG